MGRGVGRFTFGNKNPGNPRCSGCSSLPISSTNTIDYSKMAEARVVYGGRGVLTDMQQPRYGVQLFYIIYPF